MNDKQLLIKSKEKTFVCDKANYITGIISRYCFLQISMYRPSAVKMEAFFFHKMCYLVK